MEAIRELLGLIRDHKWKIVLLIQSTLLFLVLLFPLGDLSDLITAQVSTATNKSVYLQFDDMNLSLFPAPGLALQGVHVEGRSFPALRSEEVIFTPSVMSLLTQKPAGTVNARDFLRGDIEVSTKPGAKSENGTERQKVTVNAKRLSLAEMRNLANLPLQFKGNLDVQSEALLDLTFKEQPDIDITLKIDQFELPTASVESMMGPITIPELKLSNVEFKGRLSAGKLLIEDGRIGRERDELQGTIKGNMDLGIRPDMMMQTGAFTFDVDLNVKKSLRDRATLFLTLIDQHKTEAADGSARYRFRASGNSFNAPANFSTLR